ncbi:MAG: hypothetical protein GXP18_00835 [Gammaproteobacteria bacterium]|nr:hypothetical protein [Gammaproteobacteria bacterium]
MKLHRIILVALSSFFFALFPVAQAAELALPSGDLIAPVIEHTPIKKDIYTGEQIDIKATVTDNVGVKNVILFYRDADTVEFKRLKMNRDLDSFIYTAQLAATDSPGLEYYIQATDLAGNTLLFGYSFSPLTIAVVPVAVDNIAATDNSDTNAAAAATPAVEEKKKSGISKWVWIGLGVVAAGAALSGGGGNNSDPPPTTGSLTISGPTP